MNKVDPSGRFNLTVACVAALYGAFKLLPKAIGGILGTASEFIEAAFFLGAFVPALEPVIVIATIAIATIAVVGELAVAYVTIQKACG